MLDELEINGKPPLLNGRRLWALQVQSFWYGGKIEEEANVIFLNVENEWWRLYFDCGIIFWRPVEEGPKEFSFTNDDGIESSYPVIDLGADKKLNRKIIKSCTMAAIHSGSKVEFEFENGNLLSFENVGDHTIIKSQQDGCT